MTIVRLPDGSERKFEQSVTVMEVAASIGAGLVRAALAGKVNGKLMDMSHRIDADCDLAIITEKDAEGLEVIRHSSAHLLAHAVKELFPEAQVTIGPVIEDGFYYDFSYKRPFTTEDLAAIEKRMTEISKRDLKVERKVWERSEAINFLRDKESTTRHNSLSPFLEMRTFRCILKGTLPTCAGARMCRQHPS